MKKIVVIIAFIFSVLSVPAIMAQTIEKDQTKGVPIQVNKDQFLKYIYDFEKNPQQWIYAGKLPCIIDFYADWCAPCRKLHPILDKIAAEYKGKLIVYKVDTETQSELSSYFGIQSIPTLVFVPVEGAPQAAMGLMPQEDIEKVIKEVLGLDMPGGKEI